MLSSANRTCLEEDLQLAGWDIRAIANNLLQVIANANSRGYCYYSINTGLQLYYVDSLIPRPHQSLQMNGVCE